MSFLTCRVLIYNNESLCVVFWMLERWVTCWTSQLSNLDNLYNPRKTNDQNKTKTKQLMKCSQIYRVNLSVIVKLTCAQRLLKRSHFLFFLHELVESLKMKGSTWDLLSVTHTPSLLFTLLCWRCIWKLNAKGFLTDVCLQWLSRRNWLTVSIV